MLYDHLSESKIPSLDLDFDILESLEAGILRLYIGETMSGQYAMLCYAMRLWTLGFAHAQPQTLENDLRHASSIIGHVNVFWTRRKSQLPSQRLCIRTTLATNRVNSHWTVVYPIIFVHNFATPPTSSLHPRLVKGS